MAGGAGRRQRIAHDSTPLDSPQPDLDARIGWLLSMSRLHHADESFRDGRRFVEAISAAGLPVSRSTISRWEAGHITASHEAMTAYEQVLSIAPGRLSSIAAYLRTAGRSPAT